MGKLFNAGCAADIPCFYVTQLNKYTINLINNNYWDFFFNSFKQRKMKSKNF